MTSHRFARRLVIPLLAAAVTVTACGGDDGGSGDAASGKKLTGAPVKVMVVAQDESVAVAAHPETWTGAKAAAKAINDAGGLKGRPIEIIECNDKGTPNGAAACGRQAVSEKVVGSVSQGLFDGQYLAALEGAKIPSIVYPIPAEDFSSPMSFPIASDGILAIPSLTIAAKRAGKKKLAIASLDSAAALGIAKMIQGAAKSQGYTDVPLVSFSAKTVDYAPVIQKLKATGADAVTVATDLNAAIQLFKAANDSGFKATMAMNAASIQPKRIAELGPTGQNMLLSFDLPSPTLTSEVPGLKVYEEQMSAVDASDEEKTNTFALFGWVAMRAFAEVAKTVPGELTSASYLAALQQAKDVDIEGILTFSPANPGPKNFPRLSSGEVRFGTIEGDGFKLTTPEPIDGWAELGMR